MRDPAIGVLYTLAMVAVVVGVDLVFFRDKRWFWERLASNVGIVLVFGAFYFRFSRWFVSGDRITGFTYPSTALEDLVAHMRLFGDTRD